MRAIIGSGALLALAVAVATAGADPLPWQRRWRPDVDPNRIASAHVRPEDWPGEPKSPSDVSRDRLASAIEKLCGWMPQGRSQNYATWVLQYAKEFDVDPFLLGSLIHRMSRCDPDAEALSGFGLTLIVPRMYWSYIDDGTYTYWIRKNEDGWQKRALSIDRFPFTRHRLKLAESNLYFAAAFLSAWRDQHESVDGAFKQAPHRHYVSHFVWGDRVESDRAEDRILLDRRKLLLYYGAIERKDPIARRGLVLASPLDASPRVVTSFIGASRDGGERRHRGIDIEGDLREPVRAVAAGKVNFAGVDMPGSAHRKLPPKEIESVSPDEMGGGGRYVCVLHEPVDIDWVRSCYMHLEDVAVTYGEHVQRGDRLGTVGRTGMDHSAPHLHLEMHGPGGLMDPSDVLYGFVIGRQVEPEDVL